MSFEDAVLPLSFGSPTPIANGVLYAHKFPRYQSRSNATGQFDSCEQRQFLTQIKHATLPMGPSQELRAGRHPVAEFSVAPSMPAQRFSVVSPLPVGQHFWQAGSRLAQATIAKQPPSKSRTHQRTAQRKAAAVKEPNSPQGSSAIGKLLKELIGVSPDCVVKVRKIHHLGRHALAAVRDHCGTYGIVDNILSLQPPQSGRIRPTTLAFVVMRDATASNALLAAGWKQDVEGFTLVFERYEHHGAANPTEIAASTASTESYAEDATSCTNSCSCISIGNSDEGSSVATCDLRDGSEQAIHDLAEFEYWPTDDEWE